MKATIFNTSCTLNSACTYSMTLFPIILTLWNFRVHISTTNASNIPTNIETFVNKSFGLHTTLDILNVDPNDQYI